MTKSYRTRHYTTTYQVAVDDGAGQPAKKPEGGTKLAYGALRFYRVAGHDSQDNKRLLPVDHQAFFAQAVKEVKEQLQAEGITPNDVDERGLKILDQVTPEALIEEYAQQFTRPNGTFMPRDAQGRPLPDQFTLIVAKQLCVNPIGTVGSNGNNGTPRPTAPTPQSLSIFARLRLAKLPLPVPPKPSTTAS